MKRILILGFAVLIFVVVWRKFLFPYLFPASSLFYELSVDIDDNGILHHGKGVIFVGFQSQGPVRVCCAPQWTVHTVGEAFAVDLGHRGQLFVLLIGDRTREKDWNSPEPYSADAGRVALSKYFNFYANDFNNGLYYKSLIDAFARSGKQVDLRPGSLPMLVRFRDLNDPKTIEIVEPDHLDQSFGPGVKIVHASAKITGGPITTGIEKQLVWLKDTISEKQIAVRPGQITTDYWILK